MSAQAAKAAYNDPNTRQNIQDYNYDKSVSDKYHAVYHNPKTKHTILSYRGTVPTDVRDLAADAHIVFGKEHLSPEFKNALNKYNTVKSKYGNNILATGHSLGGAKVHYVARNSDLKDGITFNPGLTPSTKTSDKVKNHIVFGDPISNSGILNKNTTVHTMKASDPHTISNFTGGKFYLSGGWFNPIGDWDIAGTNVGIVNFQGGSLSQHGLFNYHDGKINFGFFSNEDKQHDDARRIIGEGLFRKQIPHGRYTQAWHDQVRKAQSNKPTFTGVLKHIGSVIKKKIFGEGFLDALTSPESINTLKSIGNVGKQFAQQNPGLFGNTDKAAMAFANRDVPAWARGGGFADDIYKNITSKIPRNKKELKLVVRAAFRKMNKPWPNLNQDPKVLIAALNKLSRQKGWQAVTFDDYEIEKMYK